MSQNQRVQKIHFNYFQQLKNQLKNLKAYDQKSRIINESVIDKVEGGIIQSVIYMPPDLGVNQFQLSSPKKEQPENVTEQQMLRGLQIQKMKIMQKMRSLEKDQFELKMNIRIKQDKQRIIYRSQVTEDDKKKLKELVKSSKNFQRALKRKNRELKKLELQRSLEDLRNMQKEIDKKRIQRKSLTIQKIKSMQLKSVQNKRKSNQMNRRLEQIKNKKYLYEQLMQRQKQIKQENEESYHRILSEVRQKSRLNIKDIEEHQRKYEVAMESYRQRSYDKLIENHIQKNKSYGDNYYRSMTKKMIDSEKISELERLKKGQIMKQKIKKFQEEINEKFKPKVSEKSKFKIEKNHSSVKVLSIFEQNLKGAEYLQIAKKLKDVEKQKQKRKTHAVPISKPEYKNYIQELNLPQYETAEKQFKNAVRGKSMSDYDSAIKVVELAEQIQAKSKKTSDAKLVNSVKHKLEILKALE